MTQQDENLEPEQQELPPQTEVPEEEPPPEAPAEPNGEADVAPDDPDEEAPEEVSSDEVAPEEVDESSAEASVEDEALEGEPVESEPEYEEVDEAALIDFAEIRPQIEAVIERDELDNARQFLEQLSRFPDTTRHVPDNVWLYRVLGDLQRAAGDVAAALESYRAAFSFDPRELALLRPFAAALVEQGEADEALRVLQSMLLYHKRKLGDAELVELYHQMGAAYERLGKLDKARGAYEKALEQRQQDATALAGLLRVVSSEGEPRELIKVRQRMIRSLDEPSARSMAMVALGDDWVERFNDPLRALDTYEQAFNEHPDNRAALERIGAVATEIEDWRRVTRSYFTLSRLCDDPEEEADWLIKASLIARDRLWEPEKALAGFRRALELDPSRLEAFKIVTSILVDNEDWVELKNAYVQLLAALKQREDADPKLLVVLWQKLGELYHTHLQNTGEAILAFNEASRLLPRNVELHERIAALSEKEADHLDMALAHLRALRMLQPGETSTLDRIGRVYLRKKEVDHAYCVFRALDYMGAALDDKASGFVERFQKPIYRAPRQPLTIELMRRYIFSEHLDRNISKVFTVVKPVMAEWAGQTRSKYGLRRRDRIKIEEQLTFNNIYRSIGGLFQYPNLPELWRKSEQRGLINGALVPDGLIVGDDLLGSGREKHIAFVVGKQLFMFLAPFYLAAIRPTDLQAVFMLARMLAFPNRFSFDLQGDLQSAYKTLSKGVRGEQLEKLRNAMSKVLAEDENPNVNLWLEAVEDSANRAGFIFCDDLKVCEDYLNDEAQRISQRPVRDRMQSLTEFSLSDEYVELRSILGIAVA